MRYMLLIYTKENVMAQRSQEEQEKMIDGHWAVMNEAVEKGVFRGAEPLAPTSTATTIRTQNGQSIITDGPFAETKEQLAGYYILDCKDLDEAISFAKRIPTQCGGETGCVEVRPLREVPAMTKKLNQFANALHG